MSEPTRVELELALQQERDWANILARPEGRRVVWSVMEFCGLMREPYTGNAETNYLLGRQSVARWMLAEKIMPNGAHLFGEMMAEHADMMAAIEAALDEQQQD